MDRMKTFFKYLLLVVIFYIFSNTMINALFKVSYSDIKDYEINVSQVYVDVTEAKASKRNGYINGIVKNNTSTVVENKYLKIILISKYDNVLGEKYVKIEELEPEQLRRFEIKFDYDNVKKFKIEMTDTMPEEADFWELVKTNVKDLLSIQKDAIFNKKKDVVEKTEDIVSTSKDVVPTLEDVVPVPNNATNIQSNDNLLKNDE